MKLHRYVEQQRLHITTKDRHSYLSSSWVICPWLILSISVLLLFRHYISHKITFGAPSSGGVLCSACGAFIYPENRFWENRKTLILAEPRSDFNCCYEQRILESHNWILFIAVSLWIWSIAKYKRPIFKGFNSLYYWAGLNLLKVNCFWSCVPWTLAYLSILRTNDFRCVFRYYYDVNANTDAAVNHCRKWLTKRLDFLLFNPDN